MGNQVANQPSQQQQPQLQATAAARRKRRWLPGKKRHQQPQLPTQSNNNNNSGNSGGGGGGSSSNGGHKQMNNHRDDINSIGDGPGGRSRQAQPPTELTPATAADRVEDAAAADAASAPSPDSANQTWSEADPQQPPQPPPPQPPAEAAAGAVPGGQRDSGISQLSTEEFERAFEELARADDAARAAPEQLSPDAAAAAAAAAACDDAEERNSPTVQLLVPRLRVKRTPAFRVAAAAASASSSAVATNSALWETIVRPDERLLLERQELLSLKRQSAYSVVNDDHMFPDAVTPCKVDSGLLSDYDVPYMDDDNFFVFDDWYVTDDRRWSYMRRSADGQAQLADWDDCRLTESAVNSAKATPHTGRRPTALLGLCFGGKSRA